MADPEQLERLGQGVKGWNKWREEHPDELVDLTEAKLVGADPEGANLRKANLEDADLRGAGLQGAS